MKTLRREDIYSGKIFNVFRELIEREGKRYFVEIVEHPGAVVILPLKRDGKVIMVKQYRYPIRKTIYELPAGTLEENEIPEKCALRELLEETGYRAKKIEYLGSFYASPGYSTEILYAYLAKELYFSKQKLEIDEKITIVDFTLKEIVNMINKGLIRDSKTITTLFLYIEKYGLNLANY